MKHKVFSLINVIGLTIGLSASFVIGLMVYYDYTYDDFHKDGDKIHRVVTDFTGLDGKFYNSGVTVALADAIKDNPNFQNLSSFYIERPFMVENKERNLEFKWPNHVIFTDEEYFNIIEYTFLAGNKTDALSGPNQVILTNERASDYFPNLNPSEIIGKTLVYNDSINVAVSGIVENLKGRTDFVFQEFISHETIMQTRLREDFLRKNWNNTNSASQLLVKVSPTANFEAINKRFADLATEHRSENSIKYNQTREFKLQPLSDIHFNTDYGVYDWSQARASKSLLNNLMLVAIFLLLLGCINFINLNTAQATQRAKEIGIRKTLGSSRKQLITQFLGETFLLVVFSALLSLVLSKWLINVFSDFVPEGLSFELIKTPFIILGIILLLLLVTVMSGFYPALVLSRFNAVSILKNQFAVGEKKVKLRKFLTIFQFSIAQIFIISTLLVGKQINFLLSQDMGFKTDAIVSVYSPRSERELAKKQVYAQKLRAIPEIKNISLGGSPPASFSSSTTDVTRTVDGKDIYNEIMLLQGDENYVGVFEINLLAGRTRKNDTIKELVINESAMKAFQFDSPEEAIGQVLEYDDEQLPIVGVMADFHQKSLRLDIKPMALVGDWYRPAFSQFQAVHISIHNTSNDGFKSVLEKIENEYKSVYTEIEDYRLVFMDETIQQFYNREQRISTLLSWSTGLSILISCLGLFGLVIYTTNRRVKEIGVRKVLGASLMQLNTLLCKEFILLVGIAFVVAAPVAWYTIHSWLQDFAYKTGISFWVFILSGVAMVIFALLVMSIKTLQAANANPVDSLRTE